MRIAFIAPYQGETVVKRRPIHRNLSLAGRVKAELIAELLQSDSHTVEILSQGEVIEPRLKFYAGFREPQPFHQSVPVYYGSALPIRFANGLWSSYSLLRLFKKRHRESPFDLIIIYDLKPPQVACANYAIRRLGLPVILEYEDDLFTDRWGKQDRTLKAKCQHNAAQKLLSRVSGGFGCAPYLLDQLPAYAPKLLLRGVVSSQIANSNGQAKGVRKNRVVFSGTLEGSQGERQLVKAWGMLGLPDWELHIAGRGPIKDDLEKLADNNRNIIFHGFLDKERNAKLLCTSKIGMNPQDPSHIPGNTFPFKIIEYLAAGTHVITTPRGTLEPQLDAGITYIPDNTSETIAESLKKVIAERAYQRTAQRAALQTYGPEAVSTSLNRLIAESMAVAGNGIVSDSRNHVA
jgi:glycosyltransferase involved in cell wall biosynthesis